LNGYPHMARLFAVGVFLLFQCFLVSGQQRSFDSLLHVLEKNPTPSQQRVDILNALASAYYDYDTEEGFNYATQAVELAKKLDYSRGLRRSLTLQGFYFYATGKYPKALEYYRRSSSVPLPEDDLLGYNLVMIGNVFRAQADYDSAMICYRKSIDILIRVNSPYQLAFAYKSLGRLYVLQWKNQLAQQTFLKALNIYKDANNRFGIADTWFSLSDVSKNNANFMEASAYINDACDLATETGDEFLKLNCLINQGDIQYRLGDYAKALVTLFQALEILESKDMPLRLSSVYSSLGDVYEALGQNEVSLKYFLEALKIAERIGTKEETAKIYSSMAWIYKNQLNFVLAYEYVKKSLLLRKEIRDEYGVSNSYNVQGVIHLQEKKYDSAIVYLEKSLEIRKRIGHREGVSACLFNIALVYEERKQYEKALKYQIDALALDETIGNKYGVGISYNSMGSLYTQLKKFREAEGFLIRAGNMAAETGSKSLLMNNYLYWSKYFEARKDFPKALYYHKKFSAINDSIYYDLSAQKLAELQALYNVQRKDQEIDLLNQQKLVSENKIQLQLSRIRTQNIIITSAIAGFIMVSGFAFITYRYNRRVKKAHQEISEQKEEIQSQSEELIDANETIAEINKKLEEKIEDRTLALSQAYKELDTFFYRSSHDFRRPLTTFMGLAEVAKVTVKDANALELFEKVKETAFNLDKMLIKLQSISDMGSQQLVYKEVMIKEIFDTVCDTFRDGLHKKHIRTSTEIRLQTPFTSYPALIKIIIENLVENAMHFSGVVNPFIKLKATQSAEYVILDIQDNGQGIPTEYHEQIFDMYFRANERSKGNGLGLYIVKKAVEKLDGSVTLSSIPLVGSTFTIMLPGARHTK
jgi:signal transduction histidine kinase